MNHHCSIPEKPECQDHFTLLHFDFQDPAGRQYNSLGRYTGCSCLQDVEIMARRVNKVLSEFYTPMEVDVNKVKVETYPNGCPQQKE
ncbi:hypothetical protein MKX03_036636, partial [Papaver bracteatum]